MNKNLKFCMVISEWRIENDSPNILCVYLLPDVKSKSQFTINERQIKEEFLKLHSHYDYDNLEITTISN